MNDQPTEPTYPNTQIILVAKGQAEFTCPIPPGSVMWLFHLTNSKADLVSGEGGASFVFALPEDDLTIAWPWQVCKQVWDEMAKRGHVPEKFPGITVA